MDFLSKYHARLFVANLLSDVLLLLFLSFIVDIESGRLDEAIIHSK
jgi:hypothetical protein